MADCGIKEYQGHLLNIKAVDSCRDFCKGDSLRITSSIFQCGYYFFYFLCFFYIQKHLMLHVLAISL